MKTAIIVEKNFNVASTVQILLEQNDYKIIDICNSTEQAVLRTSNFKYDIAVVGETECSGPETVSILLKVVTCVGIDDGYTVENDFYRAGAIAFFNLPIDPSFFAEKLNLFLERSNYCKGCTLKSAALHTQLDQVVPQLFDNLLTVKGVLRFFKATSSDGQGTRFLDHGEKSCDNMIGAINKIKHIIAVVVILAAISLYFVSKYVEYSDGQPVSSSQHFLGRMP